MELELVCSTMPWPSPICPYNRGFEHSRLEFVILIQCLQKLIILFILKKFVPNLLWSFPIAYCTTPSCCNLESFVHVHFGDSLNRCRVKTSFVMKNHLTHDPWPKSSLGVVHLMSNRPSKLVFFAHLYSLGSIFIHYNIF